MGTCVLVVEQQAASAVVWTACTPSLEDLRQACADASLGVDCLPLTERKRGHITGFGDEDRDHLFERVSRCVEFRWWAPTWEKPDRRLILGFWVTLEYKNLVTCDDFPDPPRPASVKFPKHVTAPLHSTPPLLLGQPVGHPAGATLPYTQVMTEDPIQASR